MFIAGFNHNCQKLEAIKMLLVDEWIRKLCCTQIMKYHLTLKEDELSSHEKT
jgi:hypothetical protein